MMDILAGLLDTEYVKALLGPDFIKYLVMVGIVIKTVGGHFKEMRDEVKNLRLEIHDFKDIFRTEGHKIDKRVGELEGKAEAHDYRIYTLEVKTK